MTSSNGKLNPTNKPSSSCNTKNIKAEVVYQMGITTLMQPKAQYMPERKTENSENKKKFK